MARDWHRLFIYRPEDGALIWRRRPREHFTSDRIWKTWNATWVGKVAGTPRVINGRLHGKWVGAWGAQVAQHTVVWEMHYGPVPDGFVPDHKDRNPINNRLQNLRLATQDQNAQNATRRKDNLLGLKGVTYNKVTQKYAARIQANGVLMSLGHHPTKGMAAVARAKAAIRYHGPFAVLF